MKGERDRPPEQQPKAVREHCPNQCRTGEHTIVINDLNRVTLMGHVGNDAKQANDAAPVTFSIATTSRWKNDAESLQSRTDWHNIIVFGNLRKYALKFKKGDRVYIEAQARNNHFERKIGTDTVKFREVEYLAVQIERVAAKSEADAEGGE